MDGSCLDQEFGFPVLGAGELDGYENELIEAPEDEEDIDLMNDETFGTSADTNFNWEEHHDRLVELDDEALKPKQKKSRVEHLEDDCYEDVFKIQEEFLESINQLVVDDDEEDEIENESHLDDPAIMNVTRARPVPKKPVNLDDLFGPASPPGLLDTEHLVSPNSRSIWRSPPTEYLPPKPPSNLQTLFEMVKATGPQHLENSSNTIGRLTACPPAGNICKPLTVEEIEHQLLGKVLTAEELEQHTRGNNRSSPYSSSVYSPAQQHTHALSHKQASPRVSTLMNSSIQNFMGIDGQSSNALIMSQLRQNSNSPMPFGRGTQQSPVMQGNMMNPNKFTMSHPMLRFPAGMPPLYPSFRMMGSPNGARMSRPVMMNEQMRFQRWHNFNNMTRHQLFNSYNRNQANRRGDYYHYRHHDGHRENKPVDEYAGMMTQKEKDWVIKIQMLQLQTDNPYIDDYYYMRYMIRKNARERQRQQQNKENDEPKLIIPSMSKIETKAYTPAHFEGSLGRVTTSSVHNPRQVIDLVNISVTAEDYQTKSGMRDLHKYRQLLMEVENAYIVLLDIDDLEKKLLALPEESRKYLYEERKDKVNMLYKSLCVEERDTFLQIMAIKKGRKLVARCLPVLDKGQSLNIIGAILKTLTVLIKKDHSEEGLMVLYEQMSRIISDCDFDSLVHLGEALLHDIQPNQSIKPLVSTLQNKFGSSIICCLLSQGEVVYQNTSPVDMDNQLQSSWCHFAQTVGDILDTLTISTIAKPQLQQGNMAVHLVRLLHKKQIASIEDKLKLFTDAVVQS